MVFRISFTAVSAPEIVVLQPVHFVVFEVSSVELGPDQVGRTVCVVNVDQDGSVLRGQCRVTIGRVRERRVPRTALIDEVTSWLDGTRSLFRFSDTTTTVCFQIFFISTI